MRQNLLAPLTAFRGDLRRLHGPLDCALCRTARLKSERAAGSYLTIHRSSKDAVACRIEDLDQGPMCRMWSVSAHPRHQVSTGLGASGTLALWEL